MTEDDVIRRATISGLPSDAEEAIALIDHQLDSTEDISERAELLLRKAVLLAILGNVNEARDQIETATTLAPTNSSIMLQADYLNASLSHQQGDFGLALEMMNIILDKYRDRLESSEGQVIYSDIQQHRAFELLQMARIWEALPVFQECLDFDMSMEDKSNILAGLGICYSQLKDYKSARNYLTEACRVGLTRVMAAEVHFYLGLSYAHLEDLPDSKRELKLCAELHPVPKVYAWLSKICSLMGEKAEAEEYRKLSKIM